MDSLDPEKHFSLECEALAIAAKHSVGRLGQQVYDIVRDGRWLDYFNLQCDPRTYNDVSSFRDDYFLVNTLKKSTRVPGFSDADRKLAATSGFLEAERLCKQTNENFSMSQPLCRVAEIIEAIIGPYPTRHDLAFCESRFRFGPGATTSLSGDVRLPTKFSKRVLKTTPELVSFRAFAFPEAWKTSVVDLCVETASKLAFVPKTAKTFRSICIENDLNIFVQLGIGALLKKKLAAFGLDLTTQERNRTAAKNAIRSSLATIDLSMASDTISRSVIENLLPPSWVQLLDYPRMKFTRLGDQVIELEKWSSMGNGYTFELESLIFYAIALSCVRIEDWDSVVVYGDDIIVPSYAFKRVVELLEVTGFKVNVEKSFGNGPFFESCGTDWYLGCNVRPHFMRSDAAPLPVICYRNANGLNEHSQRCGSSFSAVWSFWFQSCPSKYRFRVPNNVGDVGFHSAFDRAAPKQLRFGHQGSSFLCLLPTHKKFECDPFGAYLNSLHTQTDMQGIRYPIRGRGLSYKVAQGRSFDWPYQSTWI